MYAPENTLAAFELAIRQHADAVELDVKLTADSEVIVIHDNTLDRTTNGFGPVADLKLIAIKELDAGAYFHESFRGEKIPTLSEVFEAIGRKIFINIELTNYTSPYDHLPQRTVELVKYYNLEESIMLSSFNPRALLKTHQLLPGIPIGLLAAPGLSGSWARSSLGRLIPHSALHPEVGDTNPKLIKNCHKRGIKVHTYTVNNNEIMRSLFSWKIDGIFTDDIPLAQKALENYKVTSE
jgi:glycerophosphoryl diester phosphodiesterase